MDSHGSSKIEIVREFGQGIVFIQSVVFTFLGLGK